MTELEFHNCGNYYGNLKARVHEGQPQWCVEGYSGESWQPIPQYVYDALLRYFLEQLDAHGATKETT